MAKVPKTIKFDEDEIEMIERVSQSTGMNFSETVRFMVKHGNVEKTTVEGRKEMLNEIGRLKAKYGILSAQMAKVGTNINQIAKVANTTNVVTKDSMIKIEKVLKYIRKNVDETRKELTDLWQSQI